MAKKLTLILFITLLTLPSLQLNAQTLSQIGFIVKKALPNVENIVVIFQKPKQEQLTKEARTAYLVTRKKFHLYAILTRSDIPRALYSIRKLKNAAIIVIANGSTLNQKGVKYITGKITAKKIPVVSNRDKDTLEGVLLCVVEKGDTLETHVNKLVAFDLEINLPEEFLANCIVDVE